MIYLNKFLSRINENSAILKTPNVILLIGLNQTDIKKLKKDYGQLLVYYRERMRQQKGLRGFKNSYKKMEGKWKTRRRLVAD
jgi:hypothetical protein